MQESILDIVEQSLLNIATRYKEFSSSPTVLEADLKGFDEQLNDIMDRYNKLKGLQSTYTAEELTIKLNEFKNLYDDLVLKIQNGYFKGADGQNGTNGTNGVNGSNGLDGKDGVDGKDFTYDMFTFEQLALLKGEKGQDGENGIDGTHGLDGDDGLSAYQIAVNNGFVGSQIEWLESLKGIDGQDGSNGKDFKYSDFTPEQLALLKGSDGKNGNDGTNGVDGQNGTNGVNGADGKDFTFDMFTPTQLQQIANLVIVTPFNPTSILDRLTAIETALAIVPPVVPDYSNDILITSFAPEMPNFTYFSDFDYVVPDNVEHVWKVYKMKDNIFDISNSYILTYRVKINSEIFDFSFDMTYVGNGWEIISRTNDNTIIVDALWFGCSIEFNGDNLFVDTAFDSANGNFVPALDVALFVECRNSILDLVCLESSSDDAVVAVWLP